MTKKLVIIDDSSTQLNIIKTIFTNNGWDVCGVQSAKIGYEIIFDFAPDLIITDAIMPLMGGFQLIKMIRENEKISKIPVIVYSVLNENNAKFYIKEELSEYFLRKDNNYDELLNMAQNIVEKYPLSKEYKDEILRTGLEDIIQNKDEIPDEAPVEEQKIEIEENEEIETKKFDIEEFKKKIEKISNFSYGDEKIFSNLYSILYEELKYDLAAFCIYSFEDEAKKTYFDIRNIILSPILKNSILKKNNSPQYVLYKKYAPNLATLVNESEFLSKIEFQFEYRENIIANLAFYSQEKSKWENEEKIDEIKEVLFEFSKMRYIRRKSQNTKKEENLSKYKKPQNNFENFKKEENVYFSILQISNYTDMTQALSQEDLDITNSKISEKIIECLDKNEQIYRTDDDEYNIILFAKDNKHANYRLEYILKELKEEILPNNFYLEVFICAACCNIENNFNIIEAQKRAKNLLEETTHQESVVIYDVW